MTSRLRHRPNVRTVRSPFVIMLASVGLQIKESNLLLWLTTHFLQFIVIADYNRNVDRVTKEKRSRIMAAVHSKNTGTELAVRRFLWSHGIRYRVHAAYLPGRPDIVIPRRKLAVFVHGCFWHGHPGCSRGRLPKSRIQYWKAKIEANKNRDHLIKEKLEDKGWRQLVIWECQLRTRKAASISLPQILDSIVALCPWNATEHTHKSSTSPQA